MRIITLIENLVYKAGLVAEHGLSIYIETDDKKILFDTGQSKLFMENALKLGIEINDIDILVLSHGHYDHTGGLYPFLYRNNKAKVYAKKEIFVPKYHSKSRFIGTKYDEPNIKNRIVYVNEITEIANNVFLMPDITIYNATDTHFKGLQVKQGDDFIDDTFNDELFIAIKQNEQINIITACSHRGITNICTTATEHFKLPIAKVLGGFHLKDASTDEYNVVKDYFNKVRPQSIGLCHCTGVDNYAKMLNDCDLNIFYNCTGYETH